MIFLVGLDDKQSEKSKRVLNFGEPVVDPSSLKREQIGIGIRDSTLQVKNNAVGDGQRLNAKGSSSVKNRGKDFGKPLNTPSTCSGTGGPKQASSLINSGRTSKGRKEQESELFLDAATDPTLPTEVSFQALCFHLVYFPTTSIQIYNYYFRVIAIDHYLLGYLSL